MYSNVQYGFAIPYRSNLAVHEGSSVNARNLKTVPLITFVDPEVKEEGDPVTFGEIIIFRGAPLIEENRPPLGLPLGYRIVEVFQPRGYRVVSGDDTQSFFWFESADIAIRVRSSAWERAPYNTTHEVFDLASLSFLR